MGSMDKDVLGKILEMLPAGVMLAGEDGNVTYANKAAFDFLGIDESSLPEINIEGLIDHDSFKKETMIRTKGSERITIRLSKHAAQEGRLRGVPLGHQRDPSAPERDPEDG